jgi:hypothetical protein
MRFESGFAFSCRRRNSCFKRMNILDGDDDRDSNQENKEIIVVALTVGMEFDFIKKAL